jgi:DNA-binding NarL/FixJ family response regulator
VRVVIADDAALVRDGLALLLAEHQVEIKAKTSDAQTLIASVDKYHPDVAVVDIRMPPTYTDEGLRAAQEIRVRHPHTAVLVLSQHLEFNYAQRLIQDNPTRIGYLLKERVGRVDQLLDALNRVTSGECVIDQTIVKELLDRSRTADPLDELTSREREILTLIAEGRSNQGICQALWLSPKTVESHIRSVFSKLDIPTTSEDNRRVLAVLTYLRHGNTHQ